MDFRFEFGPGAEGGDDEPDILAFIVICHAVGILLVFGLLYCCCCRSVRLASTGSSPATAELEQLQERKRLSTGYLLWLMTGPLGNAHHFYLDRLVHGLVAVWTLNFLGVGWLMDAFLLPSYVRSFNTKLASPAAPEDVTRRKLLCRLPLMLVCTVGSLGVTVLYTPMLLHRTGVVDIDRLAAQTETNPYELLGLSRSADLSDAKAAYRKLSLKWHPDRNVACGKECEDKMSELSKAFELIKKRRAPLPEDVTWESWFRGLTSDWQIVLEFIGQKMGEGDREKADSDRAGSSDRSEL